MTDRPLPTTPPRLGTGPVSGSLAEDAAFAGVLAAFPEPVIVIGAGIRVIAFNARALDVLPALRQGDLLAIRLRDPDVLDGAARVLAAGRPQIVAWHERVPVERAFEVTLAPLDRPGAERAVVLTLRDLTESRRVERMRADFIASASHELRTPLASLLGFIETLQGAAHDDPVARDRFLSIMADQARRMARLVDDLLSLSRIEQNLHRRPSQPVDLAALARHIADTLLPLADEKGMTLALDCAEPVVVTGDRDELIRVAENLMENAIKYGGDDPGSEVAIAVRRNGEAGVLSVRDHGPGIAPEHLPRLTERFYRVDAAHSRAQGGTGLGLALVKHVLARHRGRLTIDSTLGQGSVFTASVPLHGRG